ncbi:hypothetical protein ACFS5J_06175 [Flavobacterium chuncheonense]|uniref:Uncharacterized protein n=1 Tax=Flavobacterium chuncheonense TaxID=2026653 RepID=A0ABW5YKW3_9FLAO
MEKEINRNENLNWRIIFNNSIYPLWMKLLSLFTIILSLIIAYFLIQGKVSPNLKISAFGLTTNDPISLFGIIIITTLVLSNLSSFAILLEKKYAVTITKLFVFIGFTISFISMLILPVLLKDYKFYPAFEIIILAFIYKTIKKIEHDTKTRFEKEISIRD